MKNQDIIQSVSAPLGSVIRDEISRGGKMSFARFMELALYHPERGYYTRMENPPGRYGDYYTSPHLHPAFGCLVAAQLDEMWRIMEKPRLFTVFELGAGDGLLAWQVLSSARRNFPGFFECLHYALCERSPAMRRRQRELLRAPDDFSGKIERMPEIPPGENEIAGCVLSNELFDALPVHAVVMEDGEIKELFVDAEGDSFCFAPAQPSAPEIKAYFDNCKIRLEENQRAEVCLAAVELAGRAARLLRKGFVVTIDYGDTADRLYSSSRKGGALIGYSRHRAADDALAEPGMRDISCHVNVSALIEAGERNGLDLTGFTTQTHFLLNLGLPALMRAPEMEALGAQQAVDGSIALKKLIDPDSLGGFKVLVQHKSLGRPRLRCFG